VRLVACFRNGELCAGFVDALVVLLRGDGLWYLGHGKPLFKRSFQGHSL